MKQILPFLYTFSGLLVGRVYAIKDPDGLTLVDASIGSAGAKILKQVQSASYQATDIKRILITHSHPDHIGGLKYLVENTSAEVIASEPEARVIWGEMPSPGPSDMDKTILGRLAQRMPVGQEKLPVHRLIKGGDVLEEVMEGLHVVDTPGHACGHLAFWQPHYRILFLGDVVMNMVGMTLPFKFVTPDMAENIRSIKKAAALEPELVCFGHGRPLIARAAEKLKAFADKF